ncbi:MAG: TniQ family protein [Propionivibrio sp.]
MILVKPLPLTGESFRGWIARLAHENGYRNGEWLCRHLFGRRLLAMTLRDARALVGCSDLDLEPFVGIRPQEDSCSHSLWIGGQLVDPSFMRVPLRQVCPDCLSEFGYAHGDLESIASILCPRHQRRFMTCCSTCNRPFNWLDTKLLHCKCDADLRLMAAKPVSAALIEANSLVGGDGASSRGMHSAKWSVLSSRERFNLVMMIGMLAVGECSIRDQSLDHNRAATLAEKAGEALLDWPGPLLEGLADIDKHGASLRQSLGLAYKWLRIAIADSPVLDPLRHVLNDYAANRITPLHHKSRESLGLGPRSASTLSRGAAAQRLGVSRDVLNKLIINGQFDYEIC